MLDDLRFHFGHLKKHFECCVSEGLVYGEMLLFVRSALEEVVSG